MVKTSVTEHGLMVVQECPLHGCSMQGSFPEQIEAATQYDFNLVALVVAFNTDLGTPIQGSFFVYEKRQKKRL